MVNIFNHLKLRPSVLKITNSTGTYFHGNYAMVVKKFIPVYNTVSEKWLVLWLRSKAKKV
jgi:hypothetical protein